MECLLCYSTIFDDFDNEEQSSSSPQIICKLLDMPILGTSFCNGHFCANCHEKLRHVGQLFDELEKMRLEVEVELMRSQKSSQDEFNENESRTVIVQEIEKRWAEKGDQHQIFNIKKNREEKVDDSEIDFNFDLPIQLLYPMDSNSNNVVDVDVGPADPKDFSNIKDEMRVILEPIQFTLAGLQEEAEESTFINVKEASIAKYIARDQDRVQKIHLQRTEMFKKSEKLQRVKLKTRLKKKYRSKKLTRTRIQNDQISSASVDKSPEKYDLGMTNNSSNSELYCSVCDRYFKSSGNLTRHKIECHSKSRSFHCEKCGKIFFVKRNLKKHMLVHQTECPFQCEICSKFYKTKRKLTLHLKIHGIGDITVQCEVCSKFFYCEPSKKQHMANVHGDGPQPKSHLCNICGKVYAHRSAYLTHYKSVHSGIKVKCDQCDLLFKSRDKLRYHILRVHEEKSKNFLCEEPNCSKRDYDLRKHINEVHLKKRNHVCSECGEKLVSKTRLTEHIMSKHTHEKQHFCRFCGKGFVIKSHLTRHEKENCSQNRQILLESRK